MDRKTQDPATVQDSDFRRIFQHKEILEANNRKNEEDAEKRRRSMLVRSLRLELGERYYPERVSLKVYQICHQAQKPILKRVEAIQADLAQRVADGSGVVFYGPVGTGKDHLSAYLLYQAAWTYGISARWISGLNLFGAFRDGMKKEQVEQWILERLSEPSILCISDPLPPVGAPTPWNVQILYRLLDQRAHRLKPTWATLNVANPEEADQRLSAPVFDRLKDNAELLPCFWPSHRKPRS